MILFVVKGGHPKGLQGHCSWLAECNGFPRVAENYYVVLTTKNSWLYLNYKHVTNLNYKGLLI